MPALVTNIDGMTKAKQVCAVLDIQGYNVGNVFYPRELAFVNNETKLCYELDCEFDDKVIEENKRHFNFIRHKIHGIPIKRMLSYQSSRVLLAKNLKFLLINAYPCLRTVEKKYFAVKNHYLAKILDDVEIPYLNLEKERIGYEVTPPLHLFDKHNIGYSYHCPLHFILSNNPSYDRTLRCSLRKCSNIWDWLQMKITSNMFFEMCNLTDSAPDQ